VLQGVHAAICSGEPQPETDAACAGLAGATSGTDQMSFKISEAFLPGVAAVRCGLDNPTGECSKRPGLLQGLLQVQGGVDQLIVTIIQTVQGAIGTPSSDPAATLRGGVAALSGGAGQLHAGGQTLSGGLSQLADGSRELAAGAGKLADGTGDLKAGAGKLADGNRKIAVGAGELATGLGDAADGSGQLAGGLAQAADGAPQIVDGAQQLSDEGTSLLVDAGKGTAADYGQKYALIEAGAERAEVEGMAYGAPEGARGMTAYSLELAGMDGEGSRNMARGLAALAVFGLGGGLVTAVRARLV
jgi:putative membrane protein